MGAYRNEQVGNLSLVLSPSLTVLVPAALDVTQSTVADHARKEQRVEPRERAVKAGNKTPVQGKVQIAGVVDLASLAICTRALAHIARRACQPKSTYTTHPQGSWSHRRR